MNRQPRTPAATGQHALSAIPAFTLAASQPRRGSLFLSAIGQTLCRLLLLTLALLGLMVASNAQAATCTSQSSGNWNTTTRWLCTTTPVNRVPATTDDVIIASGIIGIMAKGFHWS